MSAVPPRVALALIVALLAASIAASQAHASVSLSRSPDVHFPDRSYVVTLPEHIPLGADRVNVTENGAPVRNLRVAPVGATRRAKLGVVLAIDASSSMTGAPFAGAIDAARAFVAERDPRQPVAALTFGSGTRTLLPFTADAAKIDAALAHPGTPAGATDMYDAAMRSIQLIGSSGVRGIDDSGLRGGFVVVLSDGSDHGSTATAGEVLVAAEQANVKIYTVGLRSDRFDPEALQRLAEGSGGGYSEATSAAELTGIYAALGAQLSNAHVISYSSTVGPQRRVLVKVEVEGLGAATATYRSPRLKPSAPLVSKSDVSSLAPVLIMIVVVALLALAFLLLLRGPRQTPLDRVARFVGPNGDEPESRGVTSRLAHSAERSLRDARWWEGYAVDVDVSDSRRSPGQIVVSSFIAALVIAFALTSLTGTVLPGLAALVLVPLVTRLIVHVRADRARRRFGEQLADHLSVVGGSLRVGHSLPAALTTALDDAPDPARREFARAVADERLGMPLEDALGSIAVRMENTEVEYVALLARLQRDTGSDAAEMVDQVVVSVRERQELRRTVRTLTAQGRFALVILSILPVFSLGFLTLTNKPYVEPLYNTSGGHIVLATAVVLVILGALVIHRIVTIKT